jgi:hypothetical protein
MCIIMNKIKLTIQITVVAIIIFTIASIVYRINNIKHLFEPLLNAELLNKVIVYEFNKFLPESYVLTVGGSSDDKSKSQNDFYLFKKNDKNNMTANLILGYLDIVDFYVDSTITFDEISLKSNYWLHNSHTMGEAYEWHYIYTYLVFNTRVIPKGRNVEISGMKLDSTAVINHKYVKEFRYIGYFQEIGFNLNDKNSLIKNIPIVFKPYNPQYGSLSFLITPEGKNAFMIFFVNSGIKEDYYRYFKEIENGLDTIKVHGFPVQFKK